MNRKRTIGGVGAALMLIGAMVIAPMAANAEDNPEVVDETTIVDVPAPAEDVVEEEVVEEEVVEEDVEDIPQTTPPVDDERKLDICQRSNSATNPYQVLNVSVSSVDGIAGNSGQTPDHYGEHQGPLASSEEVAQQLKDDGIEWGDIIPPIDGVHSGQNWSAEGQAIWANGCNFVEPEPLVATASVTFTDATCKSGEILTWGTPVNASFSLDSTPSGTVGPADYSVTANAADGAEFSPDVIQLAWTGTLDGPLTGPDCGETPGDVTGSLVADECPVDETDTVGPTMVLIDATNTLDADQTLTIAVDGLGGDDDVNVVVPANGTFSSSINLDEDTYGGSVDVELFDSEGNLLDSVLAVNTDCTQNTVPIPPALEVVPATCDAAGSIKGISSGLPRGEGWGTTLDPVFAGAGTYNGTFFTEEGYVFANDLTEIPFTIVVPDKLTTDCPTELAFTGGNGEAMFGLGVIGLLSVLGGAIAIGMGLRKRSMTASLVS